MKHCAFCSNGTSFIKAHVIPEAFFRPLREDGETPLLVAGIRGEFPKRAPIGVYDRELLCSSCEAKFSPTDSYGADVLLGRFHHYFTPIRAGAEIVGYESSSVDKSRLLEFLVSILWRASTSRSPFYSAVALGSHEPAAKASLFASPPAVSDIFDAVLSRWTESDLKQVPGTALLNPHRERWDGVNAYRVYLGRVVAYIKVDKQPFTEPFASLGLRASGPCKLVTRELLRSNDLKAMRQTALVSEANRRSFLPRQRKG